MTSNDHDGFWRPSSNAATTASVFNFSNAPLAQQRLLLPIYKHKRQILHAVEHCGVVIIVGETASGKSTQIPQFLHGNGWCDNNFRLCITQPRRLACQTLCKRVQQESRASVGYAVRFESTVSEETQIVYMTDGILLKEIAGDPLLSNYSVIMVDEAHERNLQQDVLLGLLKKIRKQRPSLRIIVCSATIDAQQFLNFFVGDVKDGAEKKKQTRKRRRRRWDNKEATQDDNSHSLLQSGTILSVDGRQHAVDTFYLSTPTSNYLRSTVETALQIVSSNTTTGNILCFLPSSAEVDEAIRLAQDYVDGDHKLAFRVELLPLYAQLPYNQQARVFRVADANKRQRIIFSTNIAETSVTVPGITHVVDSGLVKLPYFDPVMDLERLITVPTSQASAQQRAGRAGRLKAGCCYRLYTEDYFRKMDEATPPEILRTNLSSFILTLKSLGVDNVLAFDMLDAPSVDALSHGLELLYALGAMDFQAELTEMGYDMAEFPTDVRVSRMLLESLREECSREVASVAAALQVRSLFVTPRGSSARRQQLQLDYEAAVSEFADSTGDHVTYTNVLQAYEDARYDRDDCKERHLDYVALRRATEVRNQLLGFLRKFGRVKSLGLATPEERRKTILYCVTAGFFFNVAKLRNDGRYYTVRGGKQQQILVTPSASSVFSTHGSHAEYIIFCETHDGSRGGIELNAVSAIDSRWLRELAPHYWK
ncbi:MAG: hypothetical protein SGILL_002136 [Bacillariaceae sp.]